MCIASWLWQSHPAYDFLLLFNRDEFFNRPTRPAHWWEQGESAPRAVAGRILAGKDERGGGTWLGCTRDGRIAFLTNFREPPLPTPALRSRGDLPLGFLESNLSPLDYARQIDKDGDQYGGFNLILVDICTRSMVYVSNRLKGEPAIQIVPPGLHVLSNGNLDSPWPKSLRLKRGFEEYTTRSGGEEIRLQEAVKELMTDTVKADRTMLPETGNAPEWEYNLSSIFIDTDSPLGRYGTRSMAAISVKPRGEIAFYERYLEGGLWKDNLIEYRIENAIESQ